MRDTSPNKNGVGDVLKAGKGSLYLYQLYQEPRRETDGTLPCPPPALMRLGVTTLRLRFSNCKTKTGPCPRELGGQVNTCTKDSMNRHALTHGLLILPMLPKAGQSRSQGSISQTDQITALTYSKNIPYHRYLSMTLLLWSLTHRRQLPYRHFQIAHTHTPQQEEEARRKVRLPQVPRLGPQPRPHTAETLPLSTLASTEDLVAVHVTAPLSFPNRPWASSAVAGNL